MPKKRKKKVETIKIEGFSADTIKEFAPKADAAEEDKLWEDYFRGSPHILELSQKERHDKPPSDEKESEKLEGTEVADPTAVTVATAASEVAAVSHTGAEEHRRAVNPQKERIRREDFIILDSTHSKSEQMVYSTMYRETISKGKNEDYFSLRKLVKMTHLGSDKTVFNALKGLCNKFSIKMVEHSNNNPIGTLYRVYIPREIFELRKENGIIIDINTKRIIATAAT